jgi:hypothetical protein
MNKNIEKYLVGINFTQLTLPSNTEIKNLGRVIPNLIIISPSSSSRIQTYVRKSDPAI